MATGAGGFASLSIMALLVLVVAVPLCSMADNILYSGETLRHQQGLTCGKYILSLTEFCNLVLYVDAEGEFQEVIWTSNTAIRRYDCKATLESNGNLVISDKNGETIWESNTKSKEGSYVLIVEKNGNVVIYGPAVWATKTNIPKATSAFITNRKARMVNVLPAHNTTDEPIKKATAAISMVINN